MRSRHDTRGLRLLIQTRLCNLSPEEKCGMDEDLDTLRSLVECFPVADLHVEVVHHLRHDDFHVKTSLRLPKRTLFTGERDVLLHPAYERCIRKLVKKVKGYKERMARVPAYKQLAQGGAGELLGGAT